MTRILVIDDDPDIRRVITYALEDEGYQVDEAPDGSIALELINRQHPDIILLDMKMPGMDGWEFAEAYRNRPDGRAPIVVITAAQDVGKRASEVDAESHVSKPFDLDLLLERISALIKTDDSG